MPPQNPLNLPNPLYTLLQRLHALSLSQESALKVPDGPYCKMRHLFATDPSAGREYSNTLMRDKFIALDEDKACCVAQIALAMGATNIVELGTSFGVSTMYLAWAVGVNARGGKTGRVVATEWEEEKARVARENWKEAGEEVERWIDLRVGDCLETLREGIETVDMVLLDIWTPVVLPAVKLLEPHFRPGTVLIADNTVRSGQGYEEYFKYINREGSGYTTITMPYDDGLELTVYRPTA